MKTLVISGIACALLFCALGCTHNDRDSAGLKRLPGVPPTEVTSQPPKSTAEQAYQTDASANGGLGLRAAASYSGNGAVVQQNVNPGPFVTAGQSQSGTAGTMPTVSALTRSADGTMSGTNDLPAATTGWGTAAANYGSADANLANSNKARQSAKKK